MPAKATGKAKAATAPAAGKPAGKTAETAPGPRPPKPAPSARLGDDLPAPAAQDAPRLSREPVSVLVARSDIVGGGVRLRANAPTSLRVARGQVIHVKHAYRLQEASTAKEEYRFLLKSAVGGVAHPPSLARLGDKWGVPDDVGGYLQHEHRLDRPGRTTLEFEVGAEYCVMGWGDGTVQALDRKDLGGRIDIDVV